jgi:hypothetical protein
MIFVMVMGCVFFEVGTVYVFHEVQPHKKLAQATMKVWNGVLCNTDYKGPNSDALHIIPNLFFNPFMLPVNQPSIFGNHVPVQWMLNQFWQFWNSNKINWTQWSFICQNLWVNNATSSDFDIFFLYTPAKDEDIYS